MEEKKKGKNIYAIISSVLMLLTIILEFNGLIKANFLCVVLSIITGICGIILSIIGIIKSVRLKKEGGKLKGIVLSIISIIVILCVLVLSVMEFEVLRYEQETGNTQFSSMVKGASLTEDEKIIGQAIKAVDNDCGIGEFKVTNIDVYKNNNEEGIEVSMAIFIDYSFNSVTLGTKPEREKVVILYYYGNDNPSASLYKSSGNVYELLSKTMYLWEKIKVNKSGILQYANDKTTRALDIH